MPYFDRFDICEAYAVLEWDWHSGGWLVERPSNRRRMESTDVQLHRMGFRPRPDLEFDTLTDNGKEKKGRKYEARIYQQFRIFNVDRNPGSMPEVRQTEGLTRQVRW